MAVRIQLRNDTAENWTDADPVLGAGEFGLETDTVQFKIGDGVSSWTELGYGISGPTGPTGPSGGPTGPIGPTGPTGITWRGEWVTGPGDPASITYAINDVVSWDNRSYIAVAPSNGFDVPPDSNAADWDLLAGRGGTGPEGPTGPSGDPRLTINPQTTSYTVQLSDAGNLVEILSGSATNFTIPTDASVNFPIGTQISILQTGTGQVTVGAVTPGTTTVNATPGFKLRSQWSAATIIKRAANVWVATGDLAV
jgi:hypothetical protein